MLYYSNIILCGIACLIRLAELTTLFDTFEESVRYTSSVRQVAPPDQCRALWGQSFDYMCVQCINKQ